MLRRLLLFLALLLVGVAAPAPGASAKPPHSGLSLYVSPSGSDSTTCTRARPCRTLGRADALARPGTIVRVAPGRYGRATLTASGTAAAPIRWLSVRRWAAKLSAHGGGPVTVAEISGKHVDFQNFDVTGSGGAGTVGIDVSGSYSEAIGDRVHNLGVPCTGDGGAGIDLSGSAVGRGQAAIRNLVTDIGAGPRDGQCRIIAGIYASVPGVKILVNIIARAVGDGITSYHRATDLVIANNTSVENGGYGILVGGSLPPFNHDSAVVNNIAAFNALGGIVECCAASPPSGGDYLNNLTYGNRRVDGPDFDSPPTRLSATLHKDPRLRNASAGNYHPRPGSPALGTGTSVDAPQFDFDGRVRPRGAAFSRGAFSSWAAPR
jgi:hypothetical protein